MPKENTHLWFAQRLATRMLGGDNAHPAAPPILEEPSLFSLGSIIPDAFFYHWQSRGRRMAKFLHGSSETTGTAVFSTMVELAGAAGSHRDKAFVLGYLSHVALDATMHPVIDALSGKRPGQPSSRDSIAGHRLLETALDRQVNSFFFYPRIITPRLADGLGVLNSAAKAAGLRPGDVRSALCAQLMVNRLVLGRGAHRLLTWLHHPPQLDMSALRNLCYAQLDQETGFSSPNPHPGGEASWRSFNRVRWAHLIDRAEQTSLRFFALCSDFWASRADKVELRAGLPHKSCN